MEGSNSLSNGSSSYIRNSPMELSGQLGEFQTHTSSLEPISYESEMHNSIYPSPASLSYNTYPMNNLPSSSMSQTPRYYQPPITNYQPPISNQFYPPNQHFQGYASYPPSSNMNQMSGFSNYPDYLQYPPNYPPFQSYPSGYEKNYYPPTMYYNPSHSHTKSNLSAKSQQFCPRGYSQPKEVRDDENILDIEKVKRGEDKRTTLMIRNIPNGYTRDAFVKIINTKCKNMYDFLYLPIDQNSHCNMGYGYVNMINLDAVVVLYENFNNCRWPHTKSEKICSICYGRLQSGSEDLLHYCSDWSVMTSEEKYHPLFFKPKTTIVNGKEVIEMVPSKPHIDYSMRKN